MELFFIVKNDFKAKRNIESTASYHKKFVSTPARTQWNLQVFGEESWERIGLLEPCTGLLGMTWRKGKIISRNNS